MSKRSGPLWSKGCEPLDIEKLWVERLDIPNWWHFRERWRCFRFKQYRGKSRQPVAEDIESEVAALSNYHFSAYMYLACSRYRLDELERTLGSAKDAMMHFRQVELLKVVLDHLYAATTAGAVEAYIIAAACQNRAPFLPSKTEAPGIGRVTNDLKKFGLHEASRWLQRTEDVLKLRHQFDHYFWPPRGVDDEGRLGVQFWKKGMTLHDHMKTMVGIPAEKWSGGGRVATTSEFGAFETVYSSASEISGVAIPPALASQPPTPLEIARNSHSDILGSLNGLYDAISGDLLDRYWNSRGISLDQSDRMGTE